MSKTQNSNNKNEDQTKKSIISINDFSLDKCPKCKKTICNHTSVANFHTLLRGDEDISIYSSDFAFKFKNDKLSNDFEDDLSIYIDDDEYCSKRTTLVGRSLQGANNTTRPISCNVVVIDRNSNNGEPVNNNNNGKNSKSQRFIISRKSYNELIMGNEIFNDEELHHLNDLSQTDEDNRTISSSTTNQTNKKKKNKKSLVMLKSSNILDNSTANIKKIKNFDDPHFSRIQSVKSLFIFPEYLTRSYKKDLKFSYFGNNSPSANQHRQQLICKLLNGEDHQSSSRGSSSSRSNAESRESSNYRSLNINKRINESSYHSISMIFIIMLLYSINLLQELFILFDYFNTKKYYWCLFSVLFLSVAQFFIIICIHLNNSVKETMTTTTMTITTASTSTTSSPTGTTETTYEMIANSNNSSTSSRYDGIFEREPFNFDFIHDGYDFACKKYSIIIKRFYFIPFIFIPGVLPAIVYIQFTRYLFNFKRLTYLNHFKSELSLSFYLLISSLFHSLPLAIINSCHLATKFSFVTFSFSSEMLTLNPVLTEKREALVILVSIFISITVGVCLFTSYYHLMKHINDTNSVSMTRKLRENCEKITQRTFLFSCFTISFIHFCYKFCFITSRLIIIGILWFLVNEKIFIILSIHILIGYLICNFKFHSVKKNMKKKQKLRLRQHFSCFLISILSFTDSFVDIVGTFQQFCNIHLYYLIFFIQNVSVMLIWFYKVMMNMQQFQNQIFEKEYYVVSKELKKEMFINDDWLSNSIQTIYAIIFLSVVICLLIVGTILRYILTNMSKKMFRRVATTVHDNMI